MTETAQPPVGFCPCCGANISKRRSVGLTARQKETLDFIAAYTAENGFSPTFDDIAAELGIRSRSGVHRLVHALHARGHVEFQPWTARSISICSHGHRNAPEPQWDHDPRADSSNPERIT